MSNPYIGKPDFQFWKHGVKNQTVFSVDRLYRKKFELGGSDKIGTGGSCFAQHVAQRLSISGYNFLDVELPPNILPRSLWKSYGFKIFSARYGNIYTARQLLELAKEAFGEIPSIESPWEKGGRYFDPIRPNIEPEGFSSPEEYKASRLVHLERVRELFLTMDVFVFTFGLTEYWEQNESARALPLAPGVVAGRFSPEAYSFRNQTSSEVFQDFVEFMSLINSHRTTECRYILTVSPVPLAATAESRHVLVSTTYSKSVLRGVAGELESKYEFIDYFPSYEIITSPFSRGIFYDVDQRNILSQGVDAVMKVFSEQHPAICSEEWGESSDINGTSEEDVDDVVCEEALLEEFSR